MRKAIFIQYVDQTLATYYQDPKFSTSDLADQLTISTRQLQRIMLKHLGSTPSEYIRAYRLDKAMQMLEYSNDVAQVALACGFSSHSYFSKCFKNTFAQSPSHFIVEQDNKM